MLEITDPIMTDAPALTRENPILAKFRVALAEMYGDRLELVVFFGSRAKGDAQPDSDYDVAIFLKGMNGGPSDRWVELHKLAELRVKFIDETGAFFDAKPYPAGRTATAPRSCTKSGAKG